MSTRHPPGASTLPGAKFMSSLRQDLLRRYAHRRSQKLSGKEPVNLRKIPSDIGAAVGETMTLTPEKVPQTMLDLFNEANGRLLLTGVPGAGKTTLLLQLAETLLERDIKLIEQKKIDFEPPLVVLLNLASWRSTFKNLDAWLAEILYLELSTHRIVADRIRQNVPLILLLDGLDEVVETERPSCLAAIGEYGSVSTHRFAVSCRKEELKALEQHIPLNIFRRFKSPIEVAELSEEQVKTQIWSWSSTISEAEGLRRVMELKQDETLLQAMRTPFYFNLAQRLFSSGKRWEQFGFSKTEDIQLREKELLEQFVENALKNGWREHSPDEVRNWLAFLASRMNQEGLVVFELRDLQYNWLDEWNIWQKIWAWAISDLGHLIEYTWLMGWTMMLAYSLLENEGVILDGDKQIWLLITVIGILFCWGIWVYDVLIKSFKKEKPYINLIIIRPILSIFNFKSRGSRKVFAFAVLLYLFKIDLIVILAILPYLLWLNVNIESVINSSIESIFWRYSIELRKPIGTPYQRFIIAAKNLRFSILQHWHLRWLLYRQDVMPLRLVHFLNDMAACHLMETDGATWRFRHRMVQEYFAGKWAEPK